MIQYLVGDTRELIATIPNGSVSLIATSPPFYQLRSYLQGDHTDKALEIGSEPDPATFLDTLLALTAEWGRVLAPWGSIAIELGDTYSGSGGAGGDYNDGGLHEGQGKFEGSARASRRSANGSIKANPKCLALIPELYRVALAYGFNPLTGAPSPAGKWLIRNVICWHRPNPAVGALGDKVRPSTSYIVIATRGKIKPGMKDRYFDLTAVRTPMLEHSVRYASTHKVTDVKGADSPSGHHKMPGYEPRPSGSPPLDAWFDEYDSDARLEDITPGDDGNAAGQQLARCNEDDGKKSSARYDYPFGERTASGGNTIMPLARWEQMCDEIDELRAERPDNPSGDHYDGTHDTWTLTTQPSGLAHYAMWPARLAERLILMMCPLAVCRVCGEPRRRVEGKTPEYAEFRSQNTTTLIDHRATAHARHLPTKGGIGSLNPGATPPPNLMETLGWTDCGCTYRAECCGLTVLEPCADCPVYITPRFRPGLVLDPFAGSGTSCCVAEIHGRDSIGIDIDARNRDLVPRRMEEVKRALFGTKPELPNQLGMFDEVLA